MATRSRSPARGPGPSLLFWLGLAFVVILLDQVTKQVIVRGFAYGDSHRVTSFFEIVRWHNTGAAFSFLAGFGGWQRWFFIGLGVAASALILWLLKRHAAQRLFCFAITMMLGGAIGNVIDRIVHGFVVDFIHVHYAAFSFPAFNLADSAITLGAICLLTDELRRVRRE